MLNISEDFRDKFNIKGTEYFDPVVLQDTKFGFSIKRKYSPTAYYKPDYDVNGDPKQVAAIWLVLRHEIPPEKDGRILITARVATLNVAGKMSDDGEGDGGKYSKKKPEEISFKNDFYYNPTTDSFSRRNGKIITGKQILDEVYNDHCYTVDPLRSLEFKFKILFRAGLDWVLVFLIYILKFLIEKIFCAKLTTKNGLFDDFKLKDNFWKYEEIKGAEGEYIEFAGVKAPKTPIVILCVILCGIAILHYQYDIKFTYLKSISSQSVFLAAHLILVLAILEIMPNKIIRPLINFLIGLRNKALFYPINPFTYRTWLLPFLIGIIFGELLYLVG